MIHVGSVDKCDSPLCAIRNLLTNRAPATAAPARFYRQAVMGGVISVRGGGKVYKWGCVGSVVSISTTTVRGVTSVIRAVFVGKSIPHVVSAYHYETVAFVNAADKTKEHGDFVSSVYKEVMLRKVLNKSGRRILKAIKRLSTSFRLVKKFDGENCDTVPWSPTIQDPETTSICWSLRSQDTRSVDTFITLLAEGFDECGNTCCYCNEHEENQRNENRENEMIM